MRFWFDTEFYENGSTIQLISIGVVAEDGRKYYAETGCAPELAGCTDWLRKNVRPHLSRGGEAERSRMKIPSELIEFMGDKPEIWAYYADYDWVALCQLFGTMMDLPKGWPMYCRDVKQLADSLGVAKLPEQTSQEHNALADVCSMSGGQKAWAEKNDVSPQYVCDVLMGRREPGIAILEALGLERVVTYRTKELFK